jgi:hypothetical protein
MAVAGKGTGNTYPPFPMTATTTTTMMTGFTGNTAVRRIRTPNPQDVLSGRGGGINSHKGNKTFREWVSQRKEEYNLAQNKKEKIAVALQVVRQVQQQVPVPGRFLQKDPTLAGGSGGHWWVEVDEAKALAKTTQALREGAPKIRQAHRKTEGGPEIKNEKAKKRKRTAPIVATEMTAETSSVDDATEKLVLQTVKQDASSLPRYKSEQMLLPTTDYSTALEQLQQNVEKAKHYAEKIRQEGQPSQPQATSTMTTLVAPLTSNKAFSVMYGEHKDNTGAKRGFNPLTMPAVDPFAETPPLMAAPEPDLAEDIPLLSLDSGRTIVVDNIDNNSAARSPYKRRKLRRVHSLALSDYDGTNLDPATDEAVEFVNPFADESNILASENDSSVVKAHVPSSVFNEWSTNGNKNAVGNNIDATDHSRIDDKTTTNRWKDKSVGGCLNRLLSFSSSSAASNFSEESQLRHDDENPISESNNNDYFFHDDIPEGDIGEGLKSIFDVVHPDGPSLDKNNSTSSLIRRTSFASRNRSLVSGRQ